MYKVEGGYTEYCATNGANTATLIDTLETVEWQRTRILRRNLEFYKGDFADPFFMSSVPPMFSAGVAFDILLHQPPLLTALNLMLSKISDTFAIVQPMLVEQEHPNTLVYLPGNEGYLYPMGENHVDFHAFSLDEVNQTQWIWGMTPSFMKAALASEGFEVTFEQTLAPFPNPRWIWWGCVAKRTHQVDGRHWSHMQPHPLLHDGWTWDESL